MSGLSEKTWKIIRKLYPAGPHDAIAELMVVECGNNLPGLSKLNEIELERFRFAALKLSGGDVDKLLGAISLAQLDWRDLLTGAGFAQSLTEHSKWADEYLGDG